MEIEQLGRKQTAATKKKISKAMTGKNNPAYKDGRRSYRRIAGAKKGQHVHHKDGDSTNNSKSNLQKFPAKGPGRAAHEKKHERAKNFKSSGGRKKPKRGYKAKRMK
ncbi:NUMOD3 domain-containing DNA-binding protein [Oceanihabitans sediminis]|uniref:NUMOD3 domain-containing DNA-binding protein n=1 Tax=Oceanihabitans sediminis TaxID=1812012 RepID=UPI00299F2BAA|nr:NUMOD3 domain-containing DNA-binding protein [Oceanihabitans sediminis]MDX1279378.1 NUMOD3 domain-containing DNA-binding protein [Oceanihabitans sediminis]